MNLRITGFMLWSLFLPFLLQAQSLLVRLESVEVTLYRDYVNPMNVMLRHDSDTVNRYVFHATGVGASMDYSDDGKVFLLPAEPQGQVTVYAEVNGIYYKAGQFKFKSVPAPPLTDATFVEVMGITKDNPKRKLSRRTSFNPAGKNIKESKLVSISGFPMNGLQAERNEVKALVFERLQNQLVPRQGAVRIESPDARIELLSTEVIGITPLPGKKRCLLSYYVEGKKAGEEWWNVMGN